MTTITWSRDTATEMLGALRNAVYELQDVGTRSQYDMIYSILDSELSYSALNVRQMFTQSRTVAELREGYGVPFIAYKLLKARAEGFALFASLVDVPPTENAESILALRNSVQIWAVQQDEEINDRGNYRYIAARQLTTVQSNLEDFEITASGGGMTVIRPREELLEALPVNARRFAVRVVPASSASTVTFTDDGFEVSGTLAPEESAQALIDGARESYRYWLRLNMGRGLVNSNAEDGAARERARAASARRFEAFVRREPDAERHVGTLPFVPNGLSSSRRWGIEVESGGARGITAPEHWDRKYDGSLRSAWDGYVEEQDFEPYDEEVTEFIRASDCSYAGDHQYEIEHYASNRGYYYELNENYINPADCEECGNITRTVHRVPETITHRRQDDDCAEFVSPILVSMHSAGLKFITEELSKQPQNDTAGVHVHVEADDLTKEQIATLIFGYDILEPILEASYQREERRFCRRRPVDNVLSAVRKVRDKSITDSDIRGERYVTLNTNALDDHGTVEFRAMGPVYDYEYLVRWAMLCRELVNVVAAGVTAKRFSKVKTWNDLTMLLAEYGKEYMRAVVYEQTGDTGHAADLIKQGREVTTEALNQDLDTFLQRMTGGMDAVARQMQEVAARLVGVGSASTSSHTWAA